MRNLRKFSAVVLAIALVLTSMTAAFAAETVTTPVNSDKATVLNQLGLYDGIDTTTFNPDLASNLTREQSTKLLLTMFGKADEAAAMTDAEVATALKGYTDADKLSSWAKKLVAYAAANDIMKGTSTTTLSPKDNILGADFATLIVRTMGYTVDDHLVAVTKLSEIAGSKVVDEYAKVDLTRDGAVGYMYGALTATTKAGTTVIANVVGTDADLKAIADKAGLLAAPVPTTLAVESVTATNLREVAVTFNKAVDKTTAELKELYTVTKNITGALDAGIASATLQADGKTVILFMTGDMSNQSEYKLNVNGVKAGTDKLVSKDNKFKPVDAGAPAVESVVSLGKKAVKVTFTEPVKLTTGTSASSYFKIDDKTVAGTLNVDKREVTIKLFSDLTVADHAITINNTSFIADFANYQAITVTKNFSVVDDAEKPTIVEAKNVTNENVTLVFSEDVDSGTVEAGKIYWKEGDFKRTADSVTKIDNRTYKIGFAGGNKLPSYQTSLYVTGVKDIAGNVIVDATTVAVTAVIDQARPEVTTFTWNKDTNKSVIIKFSKKIDDASFSTSNVVVKKVSDGTVVANTYSIGAGDTDSLTVNFAIALGEGEYTFTISGLRDTTILQNTILPYSDTISVGDSARPTVSSVIKSSNSYIINFSEKMDVSTVGSVLNIDNYWVKYTIDGNTITGRLPEGSNIEVLAGQKSVMITVPTGTILTEITVQGVKDVAGNVMVGYAKEVLAGSTTTFDIVAAKATAKDTVVVKFNQPVSEVYKENFTINTGVSTVYSLVSNAEIDSSDNTLVKLTLATKLPAAVASSYKVVTATSSYVTKSIANIAMGTLAYTSANPINDAINPSIIKNGDDKIVVANAATNDPSVGITFTRGSIWVNFDEAIDAANKDAAGTMFEVSKTDGSILAYGASADYTIGVLGTSVVTITINSTGSKVAGYDGAYYVKLTNAASYIYDAIPATDLDGTTALTKAANNFNTKTDCSTEAVAASVRMDYMVPAASITSATLNVTTGALEITGSFETGATSDIAKITVGATTLTAASSIVSVTGTKVTITVAGADLTALQTAYDTNGDKVNALALASAFLTDAVGNVSAAELAAGNTVTVSGN